MNLKKETLRILDKMSENPKFSYFFKNMKNNKISDDPQSELKEELISELADMIIIDCDIDWNLKKKIELFLRLAYYIKE